MKIETPKQLEIQNIAGDFDSMTASIAKDSMPYLFEMMSKSLYSNPIGSICREITSNCFDSHIEANVNKAVVISKRDDDEGTYISFKDVGIGLSPERIRNIYMNYFSSTKRGSDKEIGGFGLGSKTPLSYTDYFYINTIFDGVKYDYLFSKGETVPTLDLLNEESTEEHNGTEVKIYIKNYSDENKFQEELIKQLCYFENVYFLGWSISNNYKIYESENYKFRDTYQYSSEMHICLGKVPYPINWEEIDEHSIGIAVGVKFDIGELTVTPNREQLRYTDEVKAKVKAKVLLVKQEIINLYNEQTKPLTDWKEWYRLKSTRPSVKFGEYKLFLNNVKEVDKKYKLALYEDIEYYYDNENIFNKLYVCNKIIQDGKDMKHNYCDFTENFLNNRSKFAMPKHLHLSGVKNANFNYGYLIERNWDNFIGSSNFKKEFLVCYKKKKEESEDNRPYDGYITYSGGTGGGNDGLTSAFADGGSGSGSGSGDGNINFYQLPSFISQGGIIYAGGGGGSGWNYTTNTNTIYSTTVTSIGNYNHIVFDNKPAFGDGEHYFNLGFAKKAHKINSELRKLFEENLIDYDYVSEEFAKQYKKEQDENNASLQRKLNGKVFVKNIISDREEEWKVSEIEKYKGIIIYGNREDKRKLVDAINFFKGFDRFRSKEKIVITGNIRKFKKGKKEFSTPIYKTNGYGKILYKKSDYLTSKAIKIILISKQNEKYFNKENMTHIRNLYSDHKLFRQKASAIKIERLLGYYLKSQSTMEAKEFINNISKICTPTGELLTTLLAYKEKNMKSYYNGGDNLTIELKDEIFSLAKEQNLFDPLIEDTITKVETWFDGVEILKFTDITEESLPFILKYLKEKGKKLNTDYYLKYMYPKSEIVNGKDKYGQVILMFPEVVEQNETKSKFQVLTQQTA